MKQLFIILLIIAALYAGLFVLPLKDGAPIFDTADLKAHLGGKQVPSGEFDLEAGTERSGFEALVDSLPGPFGDEEARKSKATVTFYRWTDKEGNLQFTDTPPPEGIAYQEQEVYSNVNIIPSVTRDNGDKQTANTKAEPEERQDGYFSGAIELGNKARELEGVHQQRKEWMDRMSDH